MALLIFKDDGEALERHDPVTHPRLHRRAKTSINYYHLNHTDFVRARQDLRDEMEKQVRSAKIYFTRIENEDAGNDHAYEEAITSLRAKRQANAPCSSFCIVFLDKYKSEDALVGVFS